MIEEAYVSFEVAKLLKEKGFDVYGDGSFGSEIKIWMEYSPFGKIRDVSSSRPSIKGYPAPTLQMAMKWLREVHGLFISIEPCFDYELKHVVYLAFIQNVSDIDIFQEGRVEVASGYIVEAVYGKALKYCLENLI